jgi:hypothetical protein
MSTRPTTPPTTGVVAGTSGVLVGAGIVTMALFPLAIPILALLPLALPALALGLVAMLLAAPILLARRLRRRASHRVPRPASTAEPARS